MSICNDVIDRIMVEVESLKEMKTGCLYYAQNTNDKKNTWAIVFSFVDDTDDVYGKIAYQPKNSMMQCDFDIDWTMPYNQETGEVYDTEIPVSCKQDIKDLFDEWERYKTKMNL